MKYNIESKIFITFSEFNATLKKWKTMNENIVFTNGCFDIMHHGHIDSLLKSAELGTKLIVGLNSDSSVTLIKGKNRPIFNISARALMLAALGFVDAVVVFNDITPINLIAQIVPDILVKGKEYAIHEVVGYETVIKSGGQVKTLNMVPDISTSLLIDKIKLLDHDYVTSNYQIFPNRFPKQEISIF
jgi:D-glycero-beta-D-manno-heptose 1-phosphate adenylyltransferase